MTRALSYTVDGTNAGLQPVWGANGALFTAGYAWSASANAYVPLQADASGNLKVSGSGGGGGSALADMPFVDATGQLFFFQDTGSGLTTYKLQSGVYVGYTPTSPVTLAAIAGQATVTAQNSQTTLLGQIEANTVASTIGAAAPTTAAPVGFNNGGTLAGVSSTLGLPVNVATGGSAVVTGQSKLTTAGTAQQLGSNALVNGVVITAPTSNTGTITLGGSTVNNTVGGTGNGYPLSPGQSFAFSVSNTNVIWFNGTVSGDSISFGGN